MGNNNSENCKLFQEILLSTLFIKLGLKSVEDTLCSVGYGIFSPVPGGRVGILSKLLQTLKI